MVKGQLDHSYTFRIMPILIFSPVQKIMRHSLSSCLLPKISNCFSTGAVRLGKDVYGSGQNKIAEIYFNGQWVPICGHWFWENNIGADLFCQKLGFDSGEIKGKRSLQLPSDGLRVGKCNVGDSSVLQCTHEDCNQLELGGQCNNGGSCAKGQKAAIYIDCFNKGKTYLFV